MSLSRLEIYKILIVGVSPPPNIMFTLSRPLTSNAS